MFYGSVLHDGTGRLAKHVVQLHVDRTLAIVLAEDEAHIVSGLSDHIHGSAFAFGYFAYIFQIFLLHQHPHTFLTLVADYLFGREGRVSDGKPIHVDSSAGRFHQFGQAVEMSSGSMIVDGDDRVIVIFRYSSDHILYTLLHLGIRALDGIQFYTAGQLSRIHRADSSATHTYAVIVSTQDYYFFSRRRLSFKSVRLFGIADTSGKHDDFVIAIAGSIGSFLVFKGQNGSCNEWLTEFIAEIAGTVRGLGQDLTGRLIEPTAFG